MKKTLVCIICLLVLFIFMSNLMLFPKGYTAVIKDSANSKIVVENFKAHKSSSCKGFMYYIGSATKTNYYWEYIPLKTGSGCIINIPFSFITKISVTSKQSPASKYSKIYYYNFFLTDNTNLSGRVTGISDFTGKTDLGDFKIYSSGVREIVFGKKPSTTHNIRTYGNNSAKVSVSEVKKMLILKASFYKVRKNKNGCFTGYSYPMSLDFKTGASSYNVNWGKIKEFVPVKTKGKYSVIWKLKLITKKGSEYTGKSKVEGISGLTMIGKYKYRIYIPFKSDVKKIEI